MNFKKIFIDRAYYVTSKILFVMKITACLLFLSIMTVSASTLAQHISLNEKQASLETVLKKLQKQSGYDLVYSERLLNGAKPVTVNLNNTYLDDALNAIFQDQPFTYTVDNKTIVVKPKDATLTDKIASVLGLSGSFTGVVVDSLQNPLPGASINLVGPNTYQTTTDSHGSFKFPAVEQGVYTLIISYIGYQKLESKVVINGSAINLGYMLRQSTDKLDEILITGYNTTTQRLSTGAIGKVSGATIEQQPVSDPILALEGRVPGLFITQTAGNAGAALNVTIRGQTDLSAISATPPLYVIDGIPYSSTPVERSLGGYVFAGNGFSALNTINPSDIESIDVLKDADATAIYGSRGAAGVIVITTKKGKAGATKFNAEVSDGYGEATHLVQMASLSQYLNIRRQAFANDGITPTAANAPDLLTYSQTASTNFGNLLLGNTSHQSNAAFNVSGGDAYTQFIFGGNLRHESTIFDTNTADNAEQFHLNVQHKSHDNKLTLAVSVSYNIDHNSVPIYNILSTNYGLPPNYPLYNSNGSLYWGTGYTNPLAAFNEYYSLKTNNMASSATLGYNILPGLKFTADAGYNMNNAFGVEIVPANANNPAYNIAPMSALNNNYVKTYIAEPKLTYTYVLGKGKFTALIGGTWQETQTVQPYYVIGNYVDSQLATSLTALTVLAKSSNAYDYRYDSGYGRLEYSWNDELLFSGNIRRDGSSKFGTDHQFGTFGSGAAAWIFSKENIVKNTLPWLSFGKLKTSYGTSGTDAVLANYAYESLYTAGTGYGGYTSFTPSLNNTALQWELTKKLDIAIDLGFLNDRFLFSADFYRDRSSHLLGTSPLAAQTGFASYAGNLPDGAVVQNKGWEMELTSNNIKKKDFSWTTSVNFTMPQNKLLSFPNLLSSTYANTYVVGQSLNDLYVLHFTGWKNGIGTVQTANASGVPTYGIAANGKGDKIIDGNTDPKFYGGISNTFTYKRFQLDFLLQGVVRKAASGNSYFGAVPGMGYDIAESWVNLPVKYTTSYGTPSANGYSYYLGSDANVENASYLRLKNISLAYNFPSSVYRHIGMSGLQLYIHAQNVFTITKYQGLDPETLSNAVPTVRMMIAGIKTTF